MHPKNTKTVALGFNTRSDMAKEPTAAIMERSILMPHCSVGLLDRQAKCCMSSADFSC
jgi:hypothetical protein